MDMYGPVAPPARGGFPYVLQLVDDCTHVRAVYTLRHKDEAAEAVKPFIIAWVLPRGDQIQGLRGDNAAEFKGSSMRYVMRFIGGIQLEYSAPYRNWQLGVVEPGWRTLADKTRAVLAAALQYWPYAMKYVCWLTNRLPTRVTLRGCAVTLVQALNPDTAPLGLLTLRPWGCPNYVHVNDKTGRNHALQANAEVDYYLRLTGSNRTHTVLLKETGAVMKAAFGSCTFNEIAPLTAVRIRGSCLLSFPAVPPAVPTTADVKSDRSRGFEPS
ncbi:unnamed protein product [Phaeothamnion confervicola]